MQAFNWQVILRTYSNHHVMFNGAFNRAFPYKEYIFFGCLQYQFVLLQMTKETKLAWNHFKSWCEHSTYIILYLLISMSIPNCASLLAKCHVRLSLTCTRVVWVEHKLFIMLLSCHCMWLKKSNTSPYLLTANCITCVFKVWCWLPIEMFQDYVICLLTSTLKCKLSCWATP